MAIKFYFAVVLLSVCVKLTLTQSNDGCSFLREGIKKLCPKPITSESCNYDEKQIFSVLKEIPNFRRLFCTVGMEFGGIPNEDITASSIWSNDYLPGFGRLDSKKSPKADYWHPALNRYQNQWIQVDLRKPTRITGITTQGCPRSYYWVTAFRVMHGNTTGELRIMQEKGGSDLIFHGNRDRFSLVTNNFPSPVTARYFRILMDTYHTIPVLRFELLKC